MLQKCFENDITCRICPKWRNYWLIYWQSDHQIIDGHIADPLKDWLSHWTTCFATEEVAGKRCKGDWNVMLLCLGHDRHVHVLPTCKSIAMNFFFACVCACEWVCVARVNQPVQVPIFLNQWFIAQTMVYKQVAPGCYNEKRFVAKEHGNQSQMKWSGTRSQEKVSQSYSWGTDSRN